jgi:uncharacterized protein (DUF1330 family)
MSAYVIAQIQMDDPVEYQKYVSGFLPIFTRDGGEIIVTTKEECAVMEGQWAYPSTVVLKFPNVDEAQVWHDDPEYVDLAKHRHRRQKRISLS